ncbi:MAG: hypothetical protein HZA62_01975 [Rhodocyclales bacterium]|nr:hypothetical protein [Rhodocyclales bacterium]
MFDSPVSPCPVCGEMVLLDQTKAECAREHHCGGKTLCPLQEFFSGIDFSIKQPKENFRDTGY